MCEPATITLIATAASAATSAYGAYQTSSVQKQVARNNAITAEYAAQDAQRKGELDAQEINRRAAAMKSSQRTALAANGLDVAYGTAGDLQDQVDFFAESDRGTARTNAARTAYNYRTQGANYQAQSDAISPGLNAGISLLGSAGAVSDKWNTYKKGA